MLLKNELDNFQSQRHVTRLIRLGREAEGNGCHVAVVGRTRHKGHKQQVGQHIFEGERNRRQELEGTCGTGIVKERLGHRQEPHAVVHVRAVVQAVKVLVVVTHGVLLSL